MKKLSKRAVVILAVIVGLAVLYFLFSAIAEHQIKGSIDETVGERLEYKEINVNLLAGNLQLLEPEIRIGKQSIAAAEISVRGFSYYNYLFRDRIHIDKVILLFPEIEISSRGGGTNTSDKGLEEPIEIGSFEIRGGKLRLKDSLEEQLYLRFEEFDLKGIALNDSTVKERIPFTYESYRLAGDSLHVNLGPLHYLTAGSTDLLDGKLSVETIQVVPRYGKMEHQQHIPHEKDRYDVSIQRVETTNLSFSFLKDSLVLRDSLLSITGAHIAVYRDKLQPDEERIKPLYSQQIRELPVKLDISRVEVKDSEVVYEERLQETGPPATVTFQNVNGSILNIVNVDLDREDFPETKVTASSLFMNKTPLEVDWSFSVNDRYERFLIRANFDRIQGSTLDPFIKPAMNITADGTINTIAMTFSGDDDRAKGDMRLHYEDFKMNVLKKDGEERSGFLSALANLFVKNDGINRQLVHEDLEVTRDKERSFWNYMWLCLRKGAFEHLLRI